MNRNLLIAALAIPSCALADTGTTSPAAVPAPVTTVSTGSAQVTTPTPATPAAPATPANRCLPSPLSSPPFPSSDYTGPTIGVPDSTPDYPLQQWLNDYAFGRALKDDRIKIYGWIDVGGNVSTSKHSNAPNSYDVVPNSVTLDQLVLRIEREPDTVQTNESDWGFRISAMYGSDYRYTVAKGELSDQLLENNQLYGFDIPEAYFLFYSPYVAEGMVLKIGHFISPPDIEAQLAPDNYLYSHSTMFSVDPYTYFGFLDTIRLTKNWQVMFGLNAGNDIALWNGDASLNGIFLVRWDADDGNNSIYTGLSPIGLFNENFRSPGTDEGHDNIQGYFITWSHRFNDTVNMATEMYYLWQRDAQLGGNSNNGPVESFGGGGGPGPVIPGLSQAVGFVNYFNVKLSEKDYLCFRNDILDDEQGWRTGIANVYSTQTLGWVHQLNELVTLRPEVKYEHSWRGPGYDNGTKSNQVTLAADIIVRF